MDQSPLVVSLVPMMVVTPSIITIIYFYQVKYSCIHYFIFVQEKELICWLDQAVQKQILFSLKNIQEGSLGLI